VVVRIGLRNSIVKKECFGMMGLSNIIKEALFVIAYATNDLLLNEKAKNCTIYAFNGILQAIVFSPTIISSAVMAVFSVIIVALWGGLGELARDVNHVIWWGKLEAQLTAVLARLKMSEYDFIPIKSALVGLKGSSSC
jgi:hypothetical protein